ncbi:MAG: hypothetical protein R6V56_07385 [Lentisphaeria bacterium]
MVYGRAKALQELDKRRSGVTGEAAHRKAVNDENERMKEQDRQEEERWKTPR